MPDPDRSALASTSLPRHLTRGAIGFGLIGSAVALTPSAGPAALLLAAPGMVALRGCPTCWIAGLIQTISAGRLKRTCTESSCTLQPPHNGERYRIKGMNVRSCARRVARSDGFGDRGRGRI
jgi:hypothetical protein